MLDSSSVVTSRALISTTPMLLIGDINPGVTILSEASISLSALDSLIPEPISIILAPSIKISALNGFSPDPSKIVPDLIRIDSACIKLALINAKKIIFFIVLSSQR